MSKRKKDIITYLEFTKKCDLKRLFVRIWGLYTVLVEDGEEQRVLLGEEMTLEEGRKGTLEKQIIFER